MTIKVWDYMQEYLNDKDEIFSALEKVFKSGKLILGDSGIEFENKFSQFCGVKFGIGVDNATNGLFLSLLALGIGEGDEVITVPNTAIPTVSAIVSTGATPVFVDIEPDTYLMRVDQIEKVITPKTKCILPVHLYGQCVDMDALNNIAHKHSLFVLEDCSQSHGAKYKGIRCGSFGDLAVFSFYPTKPLGGYGDGGMIVTNNPEINRKLKRLRFYGADKVYYAEEHGYNSRLDEVHAEILLRKLPRLDMLNSRRRELAARYNEKLSKTSLILPKESIHNEHVYYVYVVRHSKRDLIMDELKKKDIIVNISYPWPIHTMRGYSFLNYKEGDFPVAEAAAKEIFSLPMYPQLTDNEQDYVCQTLIDILQ